MTETTEKTDHSSVIPSRPPSEWPSETSEVGLSELSDTLVTAGPEIVFQADNRGYFRRANRIARKYFGEDIVRTKARDLFERNRRGQRVLESVLSGERSSGIAVMMHRRQSGERARVRWTFAAFRDKTGEVVGALLLGSDVTKDTAHDGDGRERPVLDSLRDTEERFRNVVHASPIGLHMYRLDSQAQLILEGYNVAANQILGFDHKRFLGKPLDLAFPLLRGSDAPAKYLRAALYAEPWEHQHIEFAGDDIRLAFQLRAFQTSPGAMAVFFHDITDQERFQQQLRLAHDSLERRVEERTAELQDLTVQLVHSAKLAALGELTAGIAHELNQPLNAMKITCQGLLLDIRKQRLDEADLVDKLDSVVGMINRMAELIGRMRIFTRQTTGTEFEPTNLVEVIAGAFTFIEQQMRDHGIDVQKELSSEPLIIFASPVSLEQVLLNVLSNARHALMASSKDHKRLTVRAFEERGNAVVHVHDNGVGVPSRIAAKLFQPFFTTKEPGEGTGLGLSLSKKIMREHSGTISFESEHGEYAHFELKFPLASREDPHGSG